MTAAHVTNGSLASPSHRRAILFPITDGWLAYEILDVAEHETEDVALLSIEPPLTTSEGWNSIVEGPAEDQPLGSTDYTLWGYPDDVYYELATQPPGEPVPARPDLVCSKGHVRRRLRNVPVPSVKGTVFLELNQIAGGGCSGSPVFEKRRHSAWRLAGVYVGERRSEPPPHVGYASPIDAFREWTPPLLGHSIDTELRTSRPF